jgi:hypothetical protein
MALGNLAISAEEPQAAQQLARTAPTAKTKAAPARRTLDAIRADMAKGEAAALKLHALINRAMTIIKARRFRPVDAEGKTHPIFKQLREYESTLRSVDRHRARLRAEESALLRRVAPAADTWSEFQQ